MLGTEPSAPCLVLSRHYMMAVSALFRKEAMFELDLLELVKFLTPTLEQRVKSKQKLSVGSV